MRFLIHFLVFFLFCFVGKTQVLTLKYPIDASYYSVEFSPDGQRILAAENQTYNKSNHTYLFDSETGKELKRFKGVDRAFFTNTKNEIIAVSGNSVFVLDILTDLHVLDIDTNDWFLKNVQLIENRKFLVLERTRLSKTKFQLFELQNGKLISEWYNNSNYIYSSKENCLVFIENDSSVVSYNPMTSEVKNAKYYHETISNISINESNDFLYVLIENNCLEELKLSTLEKMDEFDACLINDPLFLKINKEGRSLWLNSLSQVSMISSNSIKKNDVSAVKTQVGSFNSRAEFKKNSAFIIRDTSLILINELNGETAAIFNVNAKIRDFDINTDNQLLMLLLEDFSIHVYNLDRRDLKYTISGNTEPYTFNFQPENPLIRYNNGVVYRNSDDEELVDLRGSELIKFSKDWEYITSLKYDEVLGYAPIITIYRFVDNRYKEEYFPDFYNLSSMSVHPTLSKAVITTYDVMMPTEENNLAKLIDLNSGKVLKVLAGHSDLVTTSAFNTKGSLIATGSYDDKVILFDAQTGVEIAVFSEQQSTIKHVEFDQSDSLLVVLTDSGIISVYNVLNKRLVYKVEKNNVSELFILNKDKKLITKNFDNEYAEWDLSTGKGLSLSLNFEGGDYVTHIPESHYFMASKEACKKMHYVNEQLEIVSFEQIDLKNNRPDLVLKSRGVKDSLLITAFYNAYLKRINKLGIDTITFRKDFSFPTCQILYNEIKRKSDLQDIEIKLRMKDANSNLFSFNIWINEVPLFGERGFSLINRRSNTLDTTITIQLSEGENRITASVINTNAIESFRSPLYVNYSLEKPYTPKTHFIGIGIDKFKEDGHDLSYSVKDVRDLSKALKDKLGDQFIIIDTLFNQNVNVSNVQALKKKLLQTNINDKVIISYSGHGLLNEEYDYFLSAYNVEFLHPENGGIPYEVFEDLLDSIPARKKLLLIDACHSGEVDKDDFKDMAAVAGAKGIVKPKGGDSENTSENPTIGLQNSFQLMQELFVNVQKGSGATIISAAAGDQFALEGGKLENGFFTYAILKYMAEQEDASVNALKKYVYTEVEKLSGGLQKPTSRIENLELDWRVW
jgi:WD40 repeat protein